MIKEEREVILTGNGQDYLIGKTVIDSNSIVKLKSHFEWTVEEYKKEENDFNKRYWQGKMQGLEDALCILEGRKVYGY